MLQPRMTPLSQAVLFVALLAGAFALAAPVEGNADLVAVVLTGTVTGATVAYALPWVYSSGESGGTPPASEE